MTAQKNSFKNSWEVRSVLFILRFMAVLLCLMYLLLTSGGVANWAMMKWVRFQPLSDLDAYATENIEKGTPEKIISWLSLRPADDRSEMIHILTPKIGGLAPSSFMFFAKWEKDLGHEDESMFWYQFARYRYRYDALRCGVASATDDLTGILDLGHRQDMEKAEKEDPDFTRKSVQRVLDFDAQYPAHNNPGEICTQIAKINNVEAKIVPEEAWAPIRHTLRSVTEFSLKEMQKKTGKEEKAN